MAYTVISSVFVKIGDVPLSTPAWECLNPLDLRMGPGTRGQNRVIPGASGVRSYPLRADAKTHQLFLTINGMRRWDGAVNSDPWEGLDENLMHLRTNLTDPDGVTIPTAVLTVPDGTTFSGLVQINDFTWINSGVEATGKLTLTIPHGSLTEDSP